MAKMRISKEKMDYTIDLLITMVTDEIANETGKNRTYTVEQIKKYVSSYFDLSPEDLDSKKRNKEIAYARQLAMYICRNLLDYSFPRIGQEFGRDHSTAMHAVNKIESDLITDASVKSNYNDIMKSIQDN